MTEPGARTAVKDDIPELVRLRALLFGALEANWGTAPAGDGWRDACAHALIPALADEAMRVVVTDSASGLACCGIGIVDRRLPSPFNPGGQIGHIFGVVTDPAYRGRGHARAVMTTLLDWFDRHGITRVDLNASPEGQHLYRSLGFVGHPDPALSRRARPR